MYLKIGVNIFQLKVEMKQAQGRPKDSQSLYGLQEIGQVADEYDDDYDGYDDDGDGEER